MLDRPFWSTPWWRGAEEVQARIRVATQQAAAGEVFRETLRYWLADGTERLVDFAMHPIRDEAGRVRFLYPTGIDITDRARAEEGAACERGRGAGDRDRPAARAAARRGLIVPAGVSVAASL